MKILFFLHPEFPEPGGATLDWVRELARSLRESGDEVVFFDPYRDKVREFDVVHVFSSREPETWASIRATGAPVVVTPAPATAAPPWRGGPKRAGGGALRALHALSQRRWPPVDQVAFLGAADFYLVPSEEWLRFVRSEWHAGPERVLVLPRQAAEAARRARQAYLQAKGRSP